MEHAQHRTPGTQVRMACVESDSQGQVRAVKQMWINRFVTRTGPGFIGRGQVGSFLVLRQALVVRDALTAEATRPANDSRFPVHDFRA